MSEHLTKNTEYDESLSWCHRCGQFTMHRRRPGEHGKGQCIDADNHKLSADAERLAAEREERDRQHPLFRDWP